MRARWLLCLPALVAAGCTPPRRLPPAQPAALAAPLPPGSGSLWHPELAANYPAIDMRAHFPGDLLTVVIDEASSGKKAAATETEGESSISASVDQFFGIPAAMVKFLPKAFQPEAIVSAKSARDSKGDATTERTGSLKADITVRVVAVDQSGNLYVEGDKIVSVNGEDQHIVLSGTVRPVDIATNNTVPSSRLADGRIDYYGRGTVGSKQWVPVAHLLWDFIWPF